jgi:hypothetical protein
MIERYQIVFDIKIFKKDFSAKKLSNLSLQKKLKKFLMVIILSKLPK